MVFHEFFTDHLRVSGILVSVFVVMLVCSVVMSICVYMWWKKRNKGDVKGNVVRIFKVLMLTEAICLQYRVLT